MPRSSQRPLGAQISHMLKDRGVDVIFGIPGVHNQEMYRGIEEAGITHVLARHEQGAGFMADGYARATGRPGVCYLITGPGFCNAMTALGQAYSDSVPVLAIASCLDETASTRGQLHQMRDQEQAGRTVCDWSETARTADAAYALVDRALSEFQSARPRPKALHVPIALLETRAPLGPPPPTVPARPVTVDITAAAQALAQAQRPLVILGGGAAGAAVAARDFLTATGAASFATFAGRGVADPDAPLHFGSYLARPDSAQIAQSADLIIAIGTELAEVDLWRDDLDHDCPMIRVDLDPEVLTRQQPDRVIPILSDAAAFFTAMTASGTDWGKTTWTAKEVIAAKTRWRAEVNAERPDILPVAEALKAALPRDTMIYSDMTQFAYGAKEVWDMDKPGHWHHPTGFGTLGYALPAAIGGAVGRKGAPTIAIAGDYGFQYTIQELATAVELQLPLPILLWDNGKLGEIEDSMVAAQIAPNAVIQQNPDFLALARAYGAYADEPASLSDLQDSVIRALAADRPTLIRMTAALSA